MRCGQTWSLTMVNPHFHSPARSITASCMRMRNVGSRNYKEKRLSWCLFKRRGRGMITQEWEELGGRPGDEEALPTYYSSTTTFSEYVLWATEGVLQLHSSFSLPKGPQQKLWCLSSKQKMGLSNVSCRILHFPRCTWSFRWIKKIHVFQLCGKCKAGC